VVEVVVEEPLLVAAEVAEPLLAVAAEVVVLP
jgi:hypothetical protein